MRASIRTTRRNSPERGSPGRILCLVSCYGKCIQIIATCYPKYEYYATSCRVGGRYRRVAYYDGVGRFVNKVADGGFPKPRNRGFGAACRRDFNALGEVNRRIGQRLGIEIGRASGRERGWMWGCGRTV